MRIHSSRPKCLEANHSHFLTIILIFGCRNFFIAAREVTRAVFRSNDDQIRTRWELWIAELYHYAEFDPVVLSD